MRSRGLRIVYLAAIAVAMIGWLWMLFEGFTWALA